MSKTIPEVGPGMARPCRSQGESAGMSWLRTSSQCLGKLRQEGHTWPMAVQGQHLLHCSLSTVHLSSRGDCRLLSATIVLLWWSPCRKSWVPLARLGSSCNPRHILTFPCGIPVQTSISSPSPASLGCPLSIPEPGRCHPSPGPAGRGPAPSRVPWNGRDVGLVQPGQVLGGEP